MVEKNILKTFIGLACVNLATFVWATNMIIGRWIKDEIGPLSLSAGRFIVASLIFAFLIRNLPCNERRFGEDRWALIAMAITGVALFSPLLYLGLHYTTAINSAIINALSPLLTIIVAAWLIRERLSAAQIGGAITGLIGVVILIAGGSAASLSAEILNIGDLIIFVAVIIWAFYSVFASKVMKYRSSLSATALSTFIGTPFLCLFAVPEILSTEPVLNFKTVVSIVYLGVAPAAIGFYAWNRGVELLGPGRAAIFVNTLPLYGAALGFIFLGEELGIEHILGGVLIVASGIVAAKSKKTEY